MPSGISYKASITACDIGQQGPQALQLLQQIQSQGITHDVTTYSTFISPCGRGKQCQEALQPHLHR